jgi:hypothetical protein
MIGKASGVLIKAGVLNSGKVMHISLIPFFVSIMGVLF